MNKSLPATKSDLDSLEGRIDKKLDFLEARVDEKLDGLEARVDEKLDGLEARVDEKLDGLEARVDEKLDKIINTLDGFVGVVDDLRTENIIGTKMLKDHEKRLLKLEKTTISHS